ncbi:MAG: hypothetical protein QXY45_04005 [Candidatus Aenigmatarchaeota archaeon]
MSQSLWKSLMYGLFIGTTVSSIVLLIFRIIPISTFGMIIILYLYSVVGGITAVFIHKKIKKTEKENKIDRNYIKKEEIPVDVEKVFENIQEIKKISKMIKNLLKTRKKLEELKKEGNSITEEIIKKMEERLTTND